MSYLEKLKKLHKGKLPKSFYLSMKYGGFTKKEEAAEHFFTLITSEPGIKKEAKKLGLI